jgi:hypothetical protein
MNTRQETLACVSVVVEGWVATLTLAKSPSRREWSI